MLIVPVLLLATHVHLDITALWVQLRRLHALLDTIVLLVLNSVTNMLVLLVLSIIALALRLLPIARAAYLACSVEPKVCDTQLVSAVQPSIVQRMLLQRNQLTKLEVNVPKVTSAHTVHLLQFPT